MGLGVLGVTPGAHRPPPSLDSLVATLDRPLPAGRPVRGPARTVRAPRGARHLEGGADSRGRRVPAGPPSSPAWRSPGDRRPLGATWCWPRRRASRPRSCGAHLAPGERSFPWEGSWQPLVVATPTLRSPSLWSGCRAGPRARRRHFRQRGRLIRRSGGAQPGRGRRRRRGTAGRHPDQSGLGGPSHGAGLGQGPGERGSAMGCPGSSRPGTSGSPSWRGWRHRYSWPVPRAPGSASP